METEVIAAFISGGGTLLATLIAAWVAHAFGRRWLDQDKLRRDLITARKDILFLLELERHYVELAKTTQAIPGLKTMRAGARVQRLEWSGQNTRSRIACYLNQQQHNSTV